MTSASSDGTRFVPALIVVDMQEDFCPPNGSLAVQEGRTIAPLINSLLAKPGFVARVATQDFHPPDHISFAPNHPAPNNKPFESFITMHNPAPGKEAETKQQQLWPVHCVAGTPGAEMIPEIDVDKVDRFVHKGQHAQVEMYSAFADNFGNLDPAITAKSVNEDLAAELRTRDVTDVFVVGLAGDYCVKYTAIDAVKAGFRSWIVEEATRCVVPTGWDKTKEELAAAGVQVITADAPQIQRLAVP
ncbi:isochorismatase family hydrolase [Penicillium riverlandense]|uniref:isochorismatase family hydrolase n=1 Tax=Penicillium riverlandense TaxID=1903569 RepID=UPI002548B338|nr:isochorismatase family hydrolase [Penicillium riverlandense]KAJ5808159.1 isochorismatase family hydrolase [Penicillium riverlandense]